MHPASNLHSHVRFVAPVAIWIGLENKYEFMILALRVLWGDDTIFVKWKSSTRLTKRRRSSSTRAKCHAKHDNSVCIWNQSYLSHGKNGNYGSEINRRRRRQLNTINGHWSTAIAIVIFVYAKALWQSSFVSVHKSILTLVIIATLARKWHFLWNVKYFFSSKDDARNGRPSIGMAQQ